MPPLTVSTYSWSESSRRPCLPSFKSLRIFTSSCLIPHASTRFFNLKEMAKLALHSGKEEKNFSQKKRPDVSRVYCLRWHERKISRLPQQRRALWMSRCWQNSFLEAESKTAHANSVLPALNRNTFSPESCLQQVKKKTNRELPVKGRLPIDMVRYQNIDWKTQGHTKLGIENFGYFFCPQLWFFNLTGWKNQAGIESQKRESKRERKGKKCGRTFTRDTISRPL